MSALVHVLHQSLTGWELALAHLTDSKTPKLQQADIVVPWGTESDSELGF